MLELLWLLLPVAAASGWFAARRSRARAPARTAGLSSDYFKGLNYLLNEQPDKAIEVFVRMVEVDGETVETHLALGNLFRRRGEVDRAIRIHQNLIARPTLSREQRTQALLELGEDYMKAGLFDRAENLFLELIELNAHTERALRHLLDIYQQEQDWEQAIAMARRLQELTGTRMHDVIAQYYCEMADRALKERDTSQAQQHIKRALSFDRDCVRASMLQGELELQHGDCKAAVRAYRRVVDQDIEYISEIIAPLRRCYLDMGNRPAFMAFLREIVQRCDAISPMLALVAEVRDQEGEDRAGDLMVEHLRRRPSVRGLNWLIEQNLAHSTGEARDDMRILHDLTTQLLQDKAVYACHQCGFTGKQLHWQCPSCKSWNTIKPIQGVVGE